LTGHHRGNAFHGQAGRWVYDGEGVPVAEDPDRACGHCGLPNGAEGHDACLGTLPGVRNACCGHGCPADAYVQPLVGGRLAGEAALAFFAERGAGPPPPPDPGAVSRARC
jgi:hypothetical protein